MTDIKQQFQEAQRTPSKLVLTTIPGNHIQTVENQRQREYIERSRNNNKQQYVNIYSEIICPKLKRKKKTCPKNKIQGNSSPADLSYKKR